MQVVGCLLVDSKLLKGTLTPLIAATQQDVKLVLSELARTECRKVLEQVASRNEALAARPTDLDGFMTFRSLLATHTAERSQVLAAVERVCCTALHFAASAHGDQFFLRLCVAPFCTCRRSDAVLWVVFTLLVGVARFDW